MAALEKLGNAQTRKTWLAHGATGALFGVEREIGKAPDRVRYCMNGFVIAVGSAVKPLHARAKALARSLGKVEVDMGETDCKVPDALAVLRKIEAMGRVGKKCATMKC